jgi:ACS family D-galactonate transporter-like MFS transporter
VGWLVERFNVNWIIAGGFLLWSAATAVTGVVHGFALLLLMRLLLGVGESVAFPSCSKILAKHCPETYRGRANASISTGLALGPASGIFFGAMLMDKYGWRPFFVSVGLLSLLWLVLWARWMPKGPGLPIAPDGRSPGMDEILLQRSAWGTFLGLFAYNYLSYFLISWLPSYLVNERGFSMQSMGAIAGSAFLVQAAVAMMGGFVADRWIAAGGTPTVVRKTFTTSGLLVASCSCIAVSGFARNDRVAVLFLFLTCIGAGLCTSNLWAITQTIAGPHASGKWTGLQNFAGNIAGIVSPLVPGFVAQRTGHFFWAFAITSAVLLCGAFSWVFIVGRVEPADWGVPARMPEIE